MSLILATLSNGWSSRYRRRLGSEDTGVQACAEPSHSISVGRSGVPTASRDSGSESLPSTSPPLGKKVHEHVRNESKGILRIVATSRKEGLAFLAALFSQPDENIHKLRDRMVVFTEPGPLSELAVGSPGFIPIIADQRVETELAESGCKTHRACRRASNRCAGRIRHHAESAEAVGLQNCSRINGD